METIETNTDQMEVIRQVLSAIDKSIHVRPIVYMDAELPYVPEKCSRSERLPARNQECACGARR